jgi:hypothetical protein
MQQLIVCVYELGEGVGAHDCVVVEGPHTEESVGVQFEIAGGFVVVQNESATIIESFR